jgi:hypothetical protein
MSQRLVALVIGNAAYEGGSELKNPDDDADDGQPSSKPAAAYWLFMAGGSVRAT